MQAGDHALKRGSNILTEKPFVYILNGDERSKRCDFCFKEIKVFKCSGCNTVFYCARECQMNDWILHKFECKYFQSVAPRKVSDDPRILGRLIIKLHIGGHNEKGYYTETCFRKFKDLMTHYDEIKVDEGEMWTVEWLKVELKGLLKDSLMPNSVELIGMYGSLKTNGFNILNEKMNSIGRGIYLGASIINHSCAPNAVVTFEGTTLHIRAIEDIPCLDFTKIFISYVDVLDFKDDRRAELKESYFFLCECSKCLNDEETKEAMAAACPNQNCYHPVNIQDEKCGTCASEITKDHKEKYHNIMQFTKIQLDKLKDMDCTSSILDLCQVCLATQKNILHPLNLLHIKILDFAFHSAISVETLDIGVCNDAIIYGEQLITGFRKYYGDWNPRLGVLYMSIALIELNLNVLQEEEPLNNPLQTQDAINNMLEAQKIIKVTHGVEHTLYKHYTNIMNMK